MVVGLVHEKGHTVGLYFHGLLIPYGRFLLFAEQAVHRADEIEHDRVAIGVFGGILKRGVCACRLTCDHE